jgi:tripartite-type tricarboxylate transporter receptor subunit TctC
VREQKVRLALARVANGHSGLIVRCEVSPNSGGAGEDIAKYIDHCGGFASPPALAADVYPDRTVRLIVPFPPGGGTDGFARILGAKLTELWGQQVIIDNRGGAQGNIGTALGAKAGARRLHDHRRPPGRAHHKPSSLCQSRLRHAARLRPVSRGTEMAFILVVHPSLPVKTMKDLAQLAKQNPASSRSRRALRDRRWRASCSG